MPVYEYRCLSCNTQFERLGLISERENGVSCPECGGKQAERLLSRFAASASANGGEPSALGGGCCGGSGACDCQA